MRLLHAFTGKSAAIIGLLALSGLSPTLATAADCDRACLGGMITQYSKRIPLPPISFKPAELDVTDDDARTEAEENLSPNIDIQPI